ncbi:type IV secretory system conjugative DNA transfer family protein [Paraclostridium bifermentans]|uniref:type IV secretory system conjugative DNA transfer family protein n=1 Tax=Paraclostridium bifermentans TaxID=1490 RepID=UPI0025AFB150|nr:type IV secretory system conjugative DNA transfer family protein [Paraclostridium bifermentans]
MKAIKITDYFQLLSTKQQLSYYKIIPHQNTRNYKSVEISKVINKCYKTISKRIYKQEKTWFIEAPTKIAYYIYISKDEGIEFYLIVPSLYNSLALDQLSSCWDKVEVKRILDIPTLKDNCSKISMEFTKEDALSLNIADKKSNEILAKQLNVVDIMSSGDKLGIYYNFNYTSPYKKLGFQTNYNKAMDKVKEGKSLDKIRLNRDSILKSVLRILIRGGEDILSGVSELLGEKRKSDDMTALNRTLGVLQKKDLSKDTKTKGQLDIISTQILLMSESKDKNIEKTNMQSLAQSFNELDGDNTLRAKKLSNKLKVDLDKCSLPSQVSSNIMSAEEVGSIVVQPGKELITKHNIESNSINEESVPNICKKGYISTGVSSKKGKSHKSYLNPNPDQDTGLAITGKQGSGKTEGLKNYSNDCIKHGDSLVILDYIGNNDLANTIQQIVPKDKLVLKDLSKMECMESIAYNEKYYTYDMDLMDKLDVISEKSQLITQLINSFNFGQDLTSAMRRFFVSAANITYAVNQHASFREIIDCLEFYDTRMNLIANIPEEFKSFCDKHVRNLLKLNDKHTKGDLKGEDNGETCESKIDRILDRVSVMAESPRLEYMLQKNVVDNINFEECFNEGKVIVIKMRQDKFGSQHMKNMLTLYFVTRIWEACVNRYSKSNGEELKRVHFMIDEPHQVPIVTNYLKPLLTQMRKYRLKPVFATQSLLQLEHILDDLKGAGFSYMLLAGSDKVNFKLLSEELKPYEMEDLLKLERFHSLNLIPDENGVLRPFITKLPSKLTIDNDNPRSINNEENDIECNSKVIDFHSKIC